MGECFGVRNTVKKSYGHLNNVWSFNNTLLNLIILKSIYDLLWTLWENIHWSNNIICRLFYRFDNGFSSFWVWELLSCLAYTYQVMFLVLSYEGFFYVKIKNCKLIKMVMKYDQSLTHCGFLGPFSMAFYSRNICLRDCGFWNLAKSSGHSRLNQRI